MSCVFPRQLIRREEQLGQRERELQQQTGELQAARRKLAEAQDKLGQLEDERQESSRLCAELQAERCGGLSVLMKIFYF